MTNIFINPGHTPQRDIDNGTDWDVGACGNGLQENIVCAEVGNLLADECKKIGFNVVGNFQSMSLHEITDVANSSGADIFVSIHCNAASSSAKGTETFYCEGSSSGRDIAQAVQSRIISSLHTLDRGVKDDTHTQHKRIHVLRNSNMPAVLIELAFISNPDDAKLLRYNQLDFAKAIALGLADFSGLSLSPDVIDSPSEPPVSHQTTNSNVIASLSAKYESNGDPACVSNNPGDLGGVSYGKYQFASNVGTVRPFLDWLSHYPDPALANYGKVLKSHPINSPAFIHLWQSIGSIDPGNFSRLQDEYMIKVYYGGIFNKLLAEHFNLDNHSVALKAVAFSRAVQNGVSGCKNLFSTACLRLGHPNLSYIDDKFFDSDIISSIYDFLVSECDLAQPDSNGIWRSPNNFCHGSKNIILALRNRFIHEKQDALSLLNSI